jgi:hypothetical protein
LSALDSQAEDFGIDRQAKGGLVAKASDKFPTARITISYAAFKTLCEIYGLSLDVPTQVAGGFVEKLIFQSQKKQPFAQTDPTPSHNGSILSQERPRIYQ